MEKPIPPTYDPEEYEELHLRLEEAEETLRAIRSGEVDAVIVTGQQGEQVYTLKEAAHPYQVLVEELNEGVLTLSIGGTILFSNSRFAEILGRRMENILGELFTSFVAPADQETARKLIGDRSGRRNKGELTLSNGLKRIPVEISLKEITFDNQIRLGVVISDISERRQAEKTIHGQADQYATLLATSSDGFWLFNSSGNILDVNEAYCRMSGYTREELLKMTISDIEAQETPEQVALYINQVMQDGSSRFESQHRKKNGDVIDVEIGVTFLKLADQFILFAHDITHRKQRMLKLEDYRLHLEEMVEERTAQLETANLKLQEEIAERKEVEGKLRESEKRYRELVQFAPAGIYEVDFRTGKFISVNDAMCQILGYSRQELLNMEPFDILDPDSQALFRTRLQKWLAGEKSNPSVEYRVLAKGGRIIIALLNVNYTTDERGAPLGATVVAYDITERKRMEEQVRQTAEELREANDELRLFNSAMIGRELRMIELKKEINTLCQTTGLPPRYGITHDKNKQ